MSVCLLNWYSPMKKKTIHFVSMTLVLFVKLSFINRLKKTFEYVDSWPKILLLRTHHLWNSTTELILIHVHEIKAFNARAHKWVFWDSLFALIGSLLDYVFLLTESTDLLPNVLKWRYYMIRHTWPEWILRSKSSK